MSMFVGSTVCAAAKDGNHRYVKSEITDYDIEKQRIVEDSPVQEYSTFSFAPDSIGKDLKHKKFIIHGTFVIEQENNEIEDQTDEKDPQPKSKLSKNSNKYKPNGDVIYTVAPPKNYPKLTTTKKTYIKNVAKNFKFTEYHTQNIKNIYINLTSQTECIGSPQYQCWNGILEFENQETVHDIHVKIDAIVTPRCKLMLCPKCFDKFQIKGYKMLCDNSQQNTPYLNVLTSTENMWLMPRNGVFFLLEKGNYHSSWQAGNYLNYVTLDNIKTAHNLIKKFNYYEHLEQDEMLLVFTKIYENTKISNAFWNAMTHVYIPKIRQYIPIHCKIETAPKLEAKTQLHERIHEYINQKALALRLINHGKTWFYTGEKTVNMVLQDLKSNNELSNSLVQLTETGKYGLIMQDHDHLGNWGVEAAPSSYHHVTFNIGKYTMSVINENGFYMR